jgi:hypothetical protein
VVHTMLSIGSAARDRSRCTYSRVFSYQSRRALGIRLYESVPSIESVTRPVGEGREEEEHDVW